VAKFVAMIVFPLAVAHEQLNSSFEIRSQNIPVRVGRVYAGLRQLLQGDAVVMGNLGLVLDRINNLRQQSVGDGRVLEGLAMELTELADRPGERLPYLAH